MDIMEHSDGVQETERVAYIYSPKLLYQLDKISQIRGRAEMVNSLISAYDLFRHLKIISPSVADEKLLKTFHSQEYLDHLKRCSSEGDEEKVLFDCEDDFGIGYDCPLVDDLFEYCCTIAGASITAAHLININRFKYVINWFGGWHHAKRDKASGFCYINDIVLCILKLRQRFNRILYIDLDQHHGDGVQEAFEYTNKVMKLSFHKWQPGFFPGTGALEERGKGNGLYYTVNVPLQSGVDDKMFTELFARVFKQIVDVYRPEVIVTQCGADALYGDPIDAQNPFNVTVDGYCKCIRTIVETSIPTVFLGGGGYHFANTARLWCSITALLARQELKRDIPEHEHFLRYGPDYEMTTSGGFTRNKNTPESVAKIYERIAENLRNVKIE